MICKWKFSGLSYEFETNDVIDAKISYNILLDKIHVEMLENVNTINRKNFERVFNIIVIRDEELDSPILTLSSRLVNFCSVMGADIDIDIM